MSVTAETRRAAHEYIKPHKRPRQQQLLEAIAAHGPMTVDELMAVLGYRDPNQVRPRLTELAQAGSLRTIGKRRSPRSGKMVAVWAITGQKESRPGAANTGTAGGPKPNPHPHYTPRPRETQYNQERKLTP